MLDKVTYSQLIINKDVLDNDDPLIILITKVENYINNINERFKKYGIENYDSILINITIIIANIRKIKSSSLMEKYKDISDELEWIKKDLINIFNYYKELKNIEDVHDE